MSTRAAVAPHPMTIALIVAMALSLLALPMPAHATKGQAVNYDVVPLTSRASPGALVAFKAIFEYDGTSTLANSRFDGVATGATFVAADSPCTGDGSTVGCALGNLVTGARISLTVQFRVEEGATSVGFTGTFSSDARQGTTPAASENLWTKSVTAQVTDADDFYGGWQPANSAPNFPEIFNDTQRTKVIAGPYKDAYAAIIEQTDAPILCDGVEQLGFGQTVELSVANGDAPVDVTITYRSADRSPGQVRIVHESEGGACSYPPGNCKRNAGNCYDAAWSGGGSNRVLVVRIQLPNNGKIKGI